MTIRQVQVDDFQTVVDASTQFIDVRQADEVAASGLEGAINIPLDQLASRLSELDADRRTVLLCRSGNRSGQAAELLDHAGFADVVNLEGGMLAYTGKGS